MVEQQNGWTHRLRQVKKKIEWMKLNSWTATEKFPVARSENIRMVAKKFETASSAKKRLFDEFWSQQLQILEFQQKDSREMSQVLKSSVVNQSVNAGLLTIQLAQNSCRYSLGDAKSRLFQNFLSWTFQSSSPRFWKFHFFAATSFKYQAKFCWKIY